jgi:hypothetical protein
LLGSVSLLEGGRLMLAPELRPPGTVSWVLAFNVLSAPLALAIAGALLGARPWARPAAWALGLGSAVIGLAFMAHALMGGAWMPRTAVALSVRTLFWLGLALWLQHSHVRQAGQYE